MTRLILIRHGQSEANKGIWWAGHTDAPLSEVGREQAAAAARYLRANEQIDVAYSSDLSRAMETARPTAEAFGLSVIPDKGLREIFSGKWEGITFAEINEKYWVDRERWFTDLANACCTGGETIAQLYERVVATVTRIAEENDGKTVLIAAHWTPILAMICHALGRDPAEIGDCPEPVNASIQILSFDEIIKGVLSQSVIVLPEVAHICDIFLKGSIVLRLSGIKFHHACLTATKLLHHQFVSFLGNQHRPLRYRALMSLIVELSYCRKYLTAEVIL